MNTPLLSWHYVALFTLLLFGATANAQLRLNQAQNSQTSEVSTQTGQSEKSSDDHSSGAAHTSPFDAVKDKKEDMAKRDAFSKHYINEDGSYTALIGAGPIHYEKNGHFYDIDHSIISNSDAGFSYANTSNLFESYFGRTAHTGIKNKTAEGEVTEFLNTSMYWEVNGRAVNEMPSADVSVSVQGDKAYYNNLYGNISAEFVMLTGKRELNYIIPSRLDISNAPANAEYLVFTEDVKLPEGWTSKASDNGILILNPAGKEMYLYENPVSTDAANELTREENTVFETLLNGNILTIMTKVKTEWLLSNERQFPVKVDPTVKVYPNNATNWTRSVASDGYNYSDFQFGRDIGYFVRGFIKYNLTSIPNNATINSAIGYIYIFDILVNNHDTNAFRFKNAIDPTSNSGETLYNSAATFYSPDQLTNQSNGWKNVSFGSLGLTAIENAFENFISLSVDPGGSWHETSIYKIRNHVGGADGSQKPYLEINYTEPITDRTLEVVGAGDGASHADGSYTFENNESVTLTSGTRAGYNVTGWTGTGSVPATGNTGSATFTITEDSSITWQWQQTGTPRNVVFHNYGGEEQLAFNNSRIATDTPVFRLSHDEYDANAYEIEINSSSDFNGTGVTQQFTGTYTVNTEANLTFNNNFTPTEGTTYYVRARVKGEAEVWSDWSTEIYSFTYQSSQETPAWFQTTQAQFETGELSGVIADVNNDVVTGTGGNRVINGDFTSGNTSGWTITKGSNTVDVVNNESTQFPGNWLRMGSPNFGVGGSGTIVVSQEIDLTNVSEITFDTGYYYSVGSPFYDNPNTKIEFKIGGALTNTTGTTEYINQPNYSGQGNSYHNFGTQTIDVSSYSGEQVIKFVMTYNVSWHGNGTVYYLIDNVIANAPPSGTITSTPIALASVKDATGYAGLTWNQTLGAATNSLTLTVQGSSDGVNFTDVTGFDAIIEAGNGEKTVDLSGLENPPAYIRLVGALDGPGVQLHDWSVSFDAEPFYDFIYHDDVVQWTPYYPGDTANPSTATSTILVKAGTATFNTDIVAGDLTVNAGANLNVEKILKLHGNNLINNGHITFKSSSVENTAQFDEFNGDITGDGLVTTERFIPARRSFRFLSSAVTTETTIRENWQEDGDNTPGWGTHITGNGGASNGFDPTNTNNPSMFELDDTAQAWVSVENTNATTLGAGTPYRIMVRGDRNTDLANNNAEASVTVLRSTGSLKTGNIRFTGGEMEENQYFFIGNPYQAIVNIQQLLDSASNIIQDHYYLWNADLSGVNGRGAYVTVDLDLDLSTPDSNANRFLQPGQAILVRSNGEGPPSVEFKESYKAVNEDLTATFRNATSRIALQLFYQDAFDNEETPTDGISIKFFEEGNNGVDNQDAPKMGNLDENLAILNGDDYLSIESRAYPEDEEIIPLFINNYRKANYVLEGTFVYPPEQTTAYLYDRFTNTHTELSEEGAVAYSFEVDPGIDGSIDSNRFEIHFSVEPLIGVDDITLSSVALYPNPFHDNSFNIAAKGLEGQRLDVQIVNMIGQVIYSEIVTVTSDGNAVVQLANSIASGVYNVKITSEDQQTISKKLMKN